MSTFTPGPWTKDSDGQLRGPDGAAVTVWAAGIATTSRTEEAEANAQLIGAAPELLFALKIAQFWLEIDGHIEGLNVVNAAIAKAEGR